MSVSTEDIKKATEIIKGNKYRPQSSYNNPGGLIDLSKEDKTFILIGDLHGSIENLVAIVEHDGNREKILKGEAVLILLGDIIHNDQTGEMLEMNTSLEVFEKVIELILEFKDSLIYIRGNHDGFDERIIKSGIKQGYEFKVFLTQARGEEYVGVANDLFESLPMFVICPGFVVAHAGPIRRGATRQQLIDIEDNPDFVRQLMWNRVHEFRGNPSLKEYDGKDIDLSIEKLGLSKDTYYIVGHNPLWQTGNKTGIWSDVTGIKNHIILISNRQTNGPYLLIENGKVTEKFAIVETGSELLWQARKYQ